MNGLIQGLDTATKIRWLGSPAPSLLSLPPFVILPCNMVNLSELVLFKVVSSSEVCMESIYELSETFFMCIQ